MPNAWSRRTIAPLALVGLAFAAPAGGAGTPAWPTCVPRATPIRIGIYEVGRVREGRLRRFACARGRWETCSPSTSCCRRTTTRPGRTRYRVLYLLHGAGGDYRTWMREGAQRLLGSLPVIAVMPNGSEASMDGNYADWQERAPGGGRRPGRASTSASWSRSSTLTSPRSQARPGVRSRGSRWAAAARRSTRPSTRGRSATRPPSPARRTRCCRWRWPSRTRPAAGATPRRTEVIWRDNDSTDLAGNLRGVRMFVRTGKRHTRPVRLPGAPGGLPAGDDPPS